MAEVSSCGALDMGLPGVGMQVTDGQFFPGLEAVRPRDNVQVSRVEDERRLARVVDIQQVAVQVQVLVPAALDCGIGRGLGEGARGKVQFRI